MEWRATDGMEGYGWNGGLLNRPWLGVRPREGVPPREGRDELAANVLAHRIDLPPAAVNR
jgi:hypothetical protein